MSNAVAHFIVRSNGVVDREATLSKFSGELSLYIAKRETDEAEISNGVNMVFDRHRGVNINTAALKSLVCAELKTAPGAMAEVGERVANYIRDNSVEGGAFRVRKGKGGGIVRLADKI